MFHLNVLSPSISVIKSWAFYEPTILSSKGSMREGKEGEGGNEKKNRDMEMSSGRPFLLELWWKAGHAHTHTRAVVVVAEDSLRFIRTAIWETGATACETPSVYTRVCVWSLTMPHWPWTFSTPNDPGASTVQISTSKPSRDTHTRTSRHAQLQTKPPT